MKFVLRTNQPKREPTNAVVKLDADGGGHDVAWFFSEKDAQEYIDWCDAGGARNITFNWPVASEREVYIQFPAIWKWVQCEQWLSDHKLKPSKKPSDMPYRWGAWRPLKDTKRPCDVFVFVHAWNRANYNQALKSFEKRTRKMK